MQYLIIFFSAAYGILSLRYASTATDKIPASLRFLFPNNFLSIFIFIPASKRVVASRVVMGLACLFLAWKMVQVNFLI